MEYLNAILGGEIGVLPTAYLGMPVGASSQSYEIWNKVVEKCEMKLARWKSQYLSRGGRHTLINSVLDALPTYMMSVFPIQFRESLAESHWHSLTDWTKSKFCGREIMRKRVITWLYGMLYQWVRDKGDLVLKTWKIKAMVKSGILKWLSCEWISFFISVRGYHFLQPI